MVQRRLWIFSVLAAVLVLPSTSQILNQNLVQIPGAEAVRPPRVSPTRR